MTENNKALGTAPTDEEMELINRYTRRAFTADEVYVFSLTLCDNDVDRDFERFTVEALFELEKLFVGKTGIIDHISSSNNQTARIFKCKVEAVPGKKTVTGDDYFKLTARAYMPIGDKNRETMLAIDSGIKKEISVGCAVKDSICSLCKKPLGTAGCTHQKGKTYGSKLCFAELMNPYDAYEWSFVAIPAQREAGVTKAFTMPNERKDKTLESIMKSLEKRTQLALTGAESEKLFDYIKELEKDAAAGREYRKSMESDFLRLISIAEPDISQDAAKAAMSGLDTKSLKEFIRAYSKKAEKILPLKPQLQCGKREKSRAFGNNEFTI